jgi:hypothetical protein
MSAGTGLVSASSVFKNGHANGGGSGSFDFGSLSKAVGYIDNDEEEVLR